MKSGIYRITCLKTGKIYIGSAINLKERWNSHYSKLNLNQHRNKYLQRAWNKYGEIFFDWDVIEYCEIDLLIEREQYYIDYMSPQYNICQTAGSNLGRKFSIEFCNRQSIIQKGKILSNETKAKISLSLIGNKRAFGNKNRCKFSNKEIKEIRYLKNMFLKDIAEKYNTNTTAIWRIIHFKTYKDVK